MHCADRGRLEHRERQLVGLPVRGPTAIVEAIQSAVLVAVEDLISGHSGDAELPAQRCYLLAFEQAGYET